MKKLRIAKTLILVSIIVVFSAVPASAALLDGKVMNWTWLYPDTSTVYEGNTSNFTVGPGSELTFINSSNIIGQLDISDTAINLNFIGGALNGATFNGMRLTDINNTISPFGSVTITSSTLPGFDASRVFFDENNIWINLQGYSYFTNTYHVTLQVTPAAVPIPGAVWLFGAGLVGLIGLRRKK